MTFLRVIGFSVLLLLGYMGFAHMLPQVVPDTSEPVEVSTEGLDMEGMIALGETIYKGKGTCTLCHNGMGRAPDTLEMDMAATFPERLADPRYKGVAAGKDGAKAIEDYIIESMKEPSAFVVAGFGKKGTNDTESPMPIVDKAPIELSSVEMNAVTAFLQDLAGLEPTVPLPSAEDTPVSDDSGDGGGEPAPLLTSGEDIIGEYGCAACHDLNGSGADIGPSLYGIGKRMDRAGVIESIIAPNAVIAEGFDADVMPADFGESLRGSELLVLADYLMSLPDAPPATDNSEVEPLATTGLEVIDKFGCAGCHDLDGSGADVGPKLNGIGQRMSADQIKTAIINPNDTIADGFEADMMPDDFADQMDDSELSLIVDYLMNLPE
ncbi:c-type cytochrome [Profundibacter sp.]